ncbi:MAG TPA: DegT/DnrJ/EryC1/StrS family aminotransferase, partial [Anaerolineaceae bacterium]|nr:DegT/DnrJ/EryC1/StrS family aminotransferase [Anaerolineaceae bacterium]
YKDFSITIDAARFGLDRDQLAVALAAENVDTRKYYEPPVHRQTAYQQYADGNSLVHTEYLATHSLSLPVWSDMEPEVTMGICEAVRRIYENTPAIRKKITAGR